MARVPYEGTPTQAPEVQAPDDLSRVQATPASFGAATAEGLEKAGSGLLDLSKFYDRVSADNATNNLLQQSTAILHGDPSKPALDANGQPIMGPDGKPMPDTGFLGKKGADALAAWPSAKEALDEAIAEQREGLRTPAARLQFDDESRRSRAMWLAQMGEYADKQQFEYAQVTNANSIALNQNMAAANLDNPAASFAAWNGLRTAIFKNDQMTAGDTPEVRQGADLKATQVFYSTQADAALGKNDPDRAKQALDEGGDALASMKGYPELAQRVRTAVAEKASIELSTAATTDALSQAAAASKASAAAGGTATGPAPAGPVYDRIGQVAAAHNATPEETDYLKRTAHIESGGGQNMVNPNNPQSQGLFGYEPGPFARAGGTNIHDSDQQTTAALHDARANARVLQAAGVTPDEGNVYIMHQQGTGGGRALLTAPPDENAIDALTPAYETHGRSAEQARAIATKAITGNGGSADMTAGQFTSLWRNKFSGGSTGGLGNGGATSTTADYLLEHEADLIANFDAKVAADPRLANDPRGQEMAHDKFVRGLKQTEQQQENQYKVDSNRVIEASAGATSWADVQRNLGPDGPALLQRFPAENPYAYATMDNRFDKKAQGRAEFYGSNFSSYLSRALAPTTDPNRITNPMQLNPFLGAGKDAAITTAGQEAIADITAIRGTPQGEAFTAQARQILGQMHGDLTFSSGPAGQFDPKGEQRFSEFSAVALPILVNAYKNGTLGQVLDPKSPDYIGNIAQHFARSTADVIKDRLDISASERDVYKMEDSATTGRDMLKSAVKAGRLSQSEAIRIGEDYGWFARASGAPAAPQRQAQRKPIFDVPLPTIHIPGFNN